MGVRRQQGEGSIYQRSSDGRWVGVVDLGWVGGKRVRKSVTAATLRELRPKLAALKASVESGVVPDDATVGDWLNHWLEQIASERVRPRTLDGYQGYVRRYLDPALGRVRLDRLKPEHVRAMLRGMEADGLSPTTRRQAYAVLHRALKVAVREQRVTRNVADYVDPPQPAKNPHGSLSRAETLAMLDLLAAYSDDGMWAVSSRFLAALLCGLRQGEALGLRWEDVDLEHGELYVRRSVQRIAGKGMVEQGVKSARSERRIPLMLPMATALAMHRQVAPDGYVWGGHRPTDPRADWDRWHGLLWSAGCERHPLHAARSTTANLLHEAGVPPRIIGDIMGHDFKVTWTHYLSSEERQLREAMTSAWRLLEAR
jgi:integrase